MRYVRAMQNQMGSVLTLHSIAGGDAEALEFRVDSAVRFVGVPLRDVPLRAGAVSYTHLDVYKRQGLGRRISCSAP